MIITIDGPSGVGKGTLARKIAEVYGYPYLETGALYRLVAFAYGDFPPGKEELIDFLQKTNFSTLTGDLYTEKVGAAASNLAKRQDVREALFRFQRAFIQQHAKGVVLDGRDCGTVIAPQAERKIFLTASLEERAHRRFAQLKEKGSVEDFGVILAQLEKRDAQDRSRVLSPLVPAEDAFILDTSALSKEAVFEKALFFLKN